MFLLYEAECHFSFVVFCHSFHVPSDITTVFSKVRKHSVLIFCKKVPNAALYTWRSSHPDVKFLPEREWMTEKKKKNRDTLGTMQIHSMKQYWKVGRGLFQSFLFFFFNIAPTIILNKCHSIYQHKETQAAAPLPPKQNKQKTNSRSSSTDSGCGSPSLGWPSWDGPQALAVVQTSVGCFVCKMAQKLASLSNCAESRGGPKPKHPFRPAWWHSCVWMQIRFPIELAMRVNENWVQQMLKC